MLMGLVAVLAVGLVAMKVATETMMRAAFAFGLLTLLIGTLGAIVRRRGAWIGFALFGWAYTLVALLTPIQDVIEAELRVSEPIEYLIDWLHPEPPGTGDEPRIMGPYGQVRHPDWVLARRYGAEIGHVIAALIFACLGAIVGRFLDEQSRPAGLTPRTRTPSTPG